MLASLLSAHQSGCHRASVCPHETDRNTLIIFLCSVIQGVRISTQGILTHATGTTYTATKQYSVTVQELNTELLLLPPRPPPKKNADPRDWKEENFSVTTTYFFLQRKYVILCNV